MFLTKHMPVLAFISQFSPFQISLVISNTVWLKGCEKYLDSLLSELVGCSNIMEGLLPACDSFTAILVSKTKYPEVKGFTRILEYLFLAKRT